VSRLGEALVLRKKHISKVNRQYRQGEKRKMNFNKSKIQVNKKCNSFDDFDSIVSYDTYDGFLLNLLRVRLALLA